MLEDRLVPANLLTLASFDGINNGGNPAGRIAVDASGNLYGATLSGGVNDSGAIFKVAAGSGIITTLASFDGINTGSFPAGGVFMDSHGNLFGTTRDGGVNGFGTVFEVVAGSNTITTLASFDGTNNGSMPVGAVVVDANDNVFGTTSAGGANGFGTVFEVAAGSGVITTLASFTSQSSPDQFPRGQGLIVDTHGNLFGTTSGDGVNNVGTVFEVAAGSGVITTLASFDGINNGSTPLGAVVVDANGNLFGTTSQGGVFSAGTVFEVAAGGNTITTLASFTGANGSYPDGDLAIDAQGNLFGSTNFGGASNGGSVFELVAGSNVITALASFSNGADARGGVVVDAKGNVFGATLSGGAHGDGSVFELVQTPKVTGVSPTGGPLAGGTTVTISGNYLANATAVYFGSNQASIVSNSANQIVATSPAGSGVVDITVVTAGGTSATTALDFFTYTPAPTVTGISPAYGPQAGGTTVTISGTNLIYVTAVYFGTAQGILLSESQTQMSVRSPAGAGVVDVTVVSAGGTSTTSAADQFTYTVAPAGLRSVRPQWTFGPGTITGAKGVIFQLQADGTLLQGSTTLDTGVLAFAVGANNVVYDLENSGQLLQYTAKTGFTLLDQGVVAVGLGPNGNLYDLESNHQLWTYSATAGWNQIDSNVLSFSLTPSGALYTLKSDGVLRQLQSGAFVNVASNIAAIASAADGSLYELHFDESLTRTLGASTTTVASNITNIALATNGTLYTQDALGNLTKISGASSTVIATGVQTFELLFDGVVMALQTNGQLKMITPAGVTTAKTGTYVSLGRRADDQTVVALDTTGNLYVFTEANRTLSKSKIIAMGVTPDGTLYTLNSSGQLSNGVSNVAAMAVTPDGTLYYLKSGNLFRIANGASSQIDSNVTAIAAATDGSLYVLHTNQKLGQITSAGTSVVNTGVTALGATPDGDVYYTQTGGQLWKVSLTAGQTLFDTNVTTMTVLPNGAVTYLQSTGQLRQVTQQAGNVLLNTGVASFLTGTDGTLTYLQTAGNLWQVSPAGVTTLLDDTVKAMNVALSGALYYLRTDGNLYQYTATAGFVNLDTHVTTMTLGPDRATLTYLKSNGQLYQYNPSNGFLLVDNAVRSFVVSNTGAVFDLESNGQLWKFSGGGWTFLSANIVSISLPANGLGVLAQDSNGNILQF